MEPIRIELATEHIDYADNLSRKWHAENIAKGRAPENAGAPPVNSELAFQHRIRGTRCEAAAYLWLKPVKWNVGQFRWKQPDLHDFIDVKGVGKSHHNLPVKPDDPPEYAYLLVDASAHPFYDIIGWCWGFEAKSMPTEERRAGSHTHYVDRDNPLLKNPELLKLVLRERQEFPGRKPAYEIA